MMKKFSTSSLNGLLRMRSSIREQEIGFAWKDPALRGTEWYGARSRGFPLPLD